LVLDKDKYRYQKFISDLGGMDIKEHNDEEKSAIKCVRDWLVTSSSRKTIPSTKIIFERLQKFKNDLPDICTMLKKDPDDLIFSDYVCTVEEWLSIS